MLNTYKRPVVGIYKRFIYKLVTRVDLMQRNACYQLTSMYKANEFDGANVSDTGHHQAAMYMGNLQGKKALSREEKGLSSIRENAGVLI